MKNTVIDFETYYSKEISVVNLGNSNYIKAADAYIVSLSVGNEAFCGTIDELKPICEQLAADQTVRPVAANSNFDQSWWEKYFPPFKNPWFCLLDQAAFHQAPRSLVGAANAFLNIKVDKTTRDQMKGIRYENLPAAEQEAVQQYCLNDTLIEAQLLEVMPPMSAFEERVAEHTRMINRRGLLINIDQVDGDKTKLEAMRFDAFKKIPWHTDYPPLSYQALVRHCKSLGISVPKSVAKTDEECEVMMSESPELNAIIMEQRRYRRSNTMLKKIETLKARLTEDNILQMDLMYCGAPHTRRWSSKGFNVQNLDKEPLTVVPETAPGAGDALKVWTRNWIIPRPGHTFLILDYAQIEPRCLNWMIENNDMMVALRSGFSYYEAYAVAAKGWKGAAGTLKKEFGKERYTKLKNECLGCGYGMGAEKYMTYAAAVGDIVTEAEAKAIVTGFRKANPGVVKFWKRLDNLIATAARDKSKHLAMMMPSGELLQHFSLRSSGKGYQSYTVKGDFTHQSLQPRLWGGTLTENVCQRMSRDLLANAIINLEDAGIRVAFHAHDEVILEIPIDSKDEARDTAMKIMTTSPDWAADLPLGVEGDWADAYTK